MLRSWRPEDAAVRHLMWAERDPRVPPHRGLDAKGHPTVAELEAEIRRAAPPTPDAPGVLALECRDGGGVVGSCGLVDTGRGAAGEPELAVELLRSAQGRGWATEASLAVLALARDLGHARTWATVWDWNTPSRRLLARLGFEDTGRTEVDPERGVTLFLVRHH
ncbi:GNAT family N-acetyltransferase [Phycicoccus avicenniae]|uniref:GNAT family N-acetyltransferase n=1 Tax=Phycicoccus avicenniae TaxID=2828860 RepID=UPI003D2DF96C